MAVTCQVLGCGSRSNRDDVKLFSIPALLHHRFTIDENEFAKKRRALWIAALKHGLTESKLKNQRVYSKRFITGKPANLQDEDYPDWLPSQGVGHPVTGHPSLNFQSRIEDVVRRDRTEKRRKRQVIELTNETVNIDGDNKEDFFKGLEAGTCSLTGEDNMFVSRLRLITFDVTDTLLKFRMPPGRQYAEVAAMHGIPCDDDDILSANFKAHFRKMNRDHPNYGLSSGLCWEDWWKRIVKGTFRDSETIEVDEKKLEKIATHLIDVYKTSACWLHCRGVFDLLSYIRSRRIPMGIISNGDPRIVQVLANMKLKHYFQFILTSYDVGIEKPDSRIFERAMSDSRLEKLRPEECLHVGDNGALDYYGARNSNWYGAIIGDTEKVLDKYPDINTSHIFHSLYHLHIHLMETSGEKLSSQRL